MSADELIESLLAAVAARPDDHALRLHVAQVLAGNGRLTDALAQISRVLAAEPTRPEALRQLAELSAELAGPVDPAKGTTGGFDWSEAERELGDTEHPFTEPIYAEEDEPISPGDEIFDVERPKLRLADIGGMDEVKARLDAAFLTPMRNPTLRRAFSKSLRGGLMLYGPPGCGKTFRPGLGRGTGPDLHQRQPGRRT